jgi:hypothetical protein
MARSGGQWWHGAEGDHPQPSVGAFATIEYDLATMCDCASNLGERDIAAHIA